ncbi:hypothetical protein JDV02_010446 [Purpureocillium takamizusanense]|uniref:Uncharacterized protein n=1 Tax=Purpureocillium takamizusanense TaxID=2060973 RepID=A0A9Q8QU19_9HYPO|nr:uncharacterized protein JDV02_010446 [Purpureocillium takamizusanense]UNI24719.1 hypothetical protein JDV02_010446 [Purpureocillium takamizusanense]
MWFPRDELPAFPRPKVLAGDLFEIPGDLAKAGKGLLDGLVGAPEETAPSSPDENNDEQPPTVPTEVLKFPPSSGPSVSTLPEVTTPPPPVPTISSSRASRSTSSTSSTSSSSVPTTTTTAQGNENAPVVVSQSSTSATASTPTQQPITETPVASQTSKSQTSSRTGPAGAIGGLLGTTTTSFAPTTTDQPPSTTSVTSFPLSATPQSTQIFISDSTTQSTPISQGGPQTSLLTSTTKSGTAPTQEPSPASPAEGYNAGRSHLKGGHKAAIALGTILTVGFFALAILLFFRRRRRRQQQRRRLSGDFTPSKGLPSGVQRLADKFHLPVPSRSRRSMKRRAQDDMGEPLVRDASQAQSRGFVFPFGASRATPVNLWLDSRGGGKACGLQRHGVLQVMPAIKDLDT